MIPTKALPERHTYRALWFTVSTITSIWFLFWILYDIFVWNKALTQARLENYFGLIISITILILGKQLGKFGLFKKQNFTKKANKKTRFQQVTEKEQDCPIEQVQKIQPVKEKENQTPQNASIPPGRKFYQGYLHKRPQSFEIPEECLECENNVNCLSPTAQTIGEANQ